MGKKFLKDVVASLSSGYDVRMGGIASFLLGDEEYDDTLCKVRRSVAMTVSAFWEYSREYCIHVPKWQIENYECVSDD